MITTANMKHQQGFSLIEVLVYLGLFVVIVTASIGFLFSLNDLLDGYRAETHLYRTGTQVLELATLAIRQGDQFDTFASIQSSAATGRMVVANTATSTSIAKIGSDLQLTLNGVSYGSMLPPEVTVTGFTVTHYPQAVGEFVRMTLELTATVGGVTRSETFHMGAVVRGAT
jgi:type II secretory pathway pseudopilin PulG